MAETSNTLNRADRDILIAVSTKVDQLTYDVKDLKNDLLTRMIKAEGRLDAIDVYHAGIDLMHFQKNSIWVDSFRSNYKFILFLGGILLGTLGGLVDHFMSKLFHY